MKNDTMNGKEIGFINLHGVRNTLKIHNKNFYLSLNGKFVKFVKTSWVKRQRILCQDDKAKKLVPLTFFSS